MNTITAPSLRRRIQKPIRHLWARSRLNTSWDGRFATFLFFLALGLGFCTYAALRSVPPFDSNPDILIWLLNVDLIVLCGLGMLIARRVVLIYTVLRRGIPGARLHLRLVYIFGLLAMAPAVIMTIFSLFFFHYGVQTWFSDRVKTAVQESQEVAEAYLREHHQVIKADVLAMAKDLDHESMLAIVNPAGFNKFIQTQSIIRGLPEVVLFQKSGTVLNETGISTGFDMDDVPAYALDRADSGDVVLLTDMDDSLVRALIKMTNFPDAYLFVGRPVEANVLKHLETTKEASQKYNEMTTHYTGLRTSVTLIYVVVAVVLLLSAIWFALVFARRLSLPITQLIEASERVRQGELTSSIQDNSGFEEFDFLNRSFNRMTKQIRDQRDELIEANRRMDERRQFTETILAGVTSGVLGLDKSGVVTLANNSAAQILQKDNKEIVGADAETLIPGIGELIIQAYAKPHKVHQSDIRIQQANGARRVFLVRVTIELLGEKDVGAIITFDDITNLQSAQRKAAWADVARRIAHEIKNPLTPIQLSAERLKRKYLSKLETDDQAIFSQCIDTIVRHVDDIGHMVNEFSAFARLPEPKFQPCQIIPVLRDSILFYREAHPGLRFIGLDSLDRLKDVQIVCDEQQIRQVMTNILQNAIESIDERGKKEPGRSLVLGIYARKTEDEIFISLGDSGLGFPKDHDLDSLTEPYVTFKEKGTGLGLAIVKKIMEDHGGRIIFGQENQLELTPQLAEEWANMGGATVTLVLPLKDN